MLLIIANVTANASVWTRSTQKLIIFRQQPIGQIIFEVMRFVRLLHNNGNCSFGQMTANLTHNLSEEGQKCQ